MNDEQSTQLDPSFFYLQETREVPTKRLSKKEVRYSEPDEMEQIR